MSDLVAVTTKPSSAEIAAHTSSVTKKEALSKQKVRNLFVFPAWTFSACFWYKRSFRVLNAPTISEHAKFYFW